MSLGAILVIGEKSGEFPKGISDVGPARPLAQPLSCIEVLGRTAVDRTIERFLVAGVDFVSVLASAQASCALTPFPQLGSKVNFRVVGNLDSAIQQQVRDFLQDGIEHSFINWASTYVETDFMDLFYFHRASRQSVTRAFDRDGPLDLWVVDCDRAGAFCREKFVEISLDQKAAYFVREYVNRITHPRDLRRLAEDSLRGTCERHPSGREIRPGVWVDTEAEICRGARLVAPAYIGRRSRVSEDCLITRFSTIERDCQIECGTVIEDSSVLAETHIGIWLDVCHAVVSGNKIWSLGRDATVEIGDPRIMRSVLRSGVTSVPRSSLPSSALAAPSLHRPTLDGEPSNGRHPMAALWQFGANLIQEYRSS